MSVARRLAAAMVVAACIGGAASLAAEQEPAGRKVTERVQPVYPPVAQKAHMTGTVKLTVTVSAEGTVKALKARGGNPVLIEAAEEAVKRWKYEPAKTESSESVTINFQAPE